MRLHSTRLDGVRSGMLFFYFRFHLIRKERDRRASIIKFTTSKCPLHFSGCGIWMIQNYSIQAHDKAN